MGWTDGLKGSALLPTGQAKSFTSSQGQAQIADPLNILGMNNTPNVSSVAGVGGPDTGSRYIDPNGVEQNHSLIQQPDGSYLNPATGTRYADPAGVNPVAAQNTAQQIAGATQNSQGFLDRNQVQDQRGGAAYAGQQAFGNDLNQVIRNPNAPTVSTSVMNQALGNIDRSQLAGVAGVGGANAAAARKQSLMNMGNLDAQAAGSAAVARATEANGARQAQATNLQNMAGNSLEATGQNNQAGAAFADLGMKGAQANQTEQDKINQSNQENANNNKKGAFGFLGGAAGGLTKLL